MPFDVPPFPVLFAFVGLLIGAVIDARTGKIPNWLTFSMMALGLAVWTSLGDPLFSVKGIGSAFAIHFTLWALHVVRGGDAKLVMGAGAFLGWSEVIDLTAWYAVIYLPAGLILLWWKGRLGNLGKATKRLRGGKSLKTAPADGPVQDTEDLTYLRTGPVIALAGVAASFTNVLNIA